MGEPIDVQWPHQLEMPAPFALQDLKDRLANRGSIIHFRRDAEAEKLAKLEVSVEPLLHWSGCKHEPDSMCELCITSPTPPSPTNFLDISNGEARCKDLDCAGQLAS